MLPSLLQFDSAIKCVEAELSNVYDADMGKDSCPAASVPITTSVCEPWVVFSRHPSWSTRPDMTR